MSYREERTISFHFSIRLSYFMHVIVVRKVLSLARKMNYLKYCRQKHSFVRKTTYLNQTRRTATALSKCAGWRCDFYLLLFSKFTTTVAVIYLQV